MMNTLKLSKTKFRPSTSLKLNTTPLTTATNTQTTLTNIGRDSAESSWSNRELKKIPTHSKLHNGLLNIMGT